MHIGHHRSRWFARQHPLEVTARQAVLALEKERPRQFQAHPHQVGSIDQDGAQGGDGRFQQRIPHISGGAGLLRCTDRSDTDEEQHFLLGVAVPYQGLQQDQSLVELELLYQRLGCGHVGTG